MIRMVIMGNVQSQLRPIMSTTQADKKAVAIDPPKCREYKRMTSKVMKNYVGDDFELLDEPLRVEIDIYREIPKSWTAKKHKQAVDREIYPTSKNDIDNLSKPIMDSATGVVWKDDGCVVELESKKVYSDFPRAEIRIYKISELTKS